MFMTDTELTDLLHCTYCDKLYGLYYKFNNFNLTINMYGIIHRKYKYKKILKNKNKLYFTTEKNNNIIENKI